MRNLAFLMVFLFGCDNNDTILVFLLSFISCLSATDDHLLSLTYLVTVPLNAIKILKAVSDYSFTDVSLVLQHYTGADKCSPDLIV